MSAPMSAHRLRVAHLNPNADNPFDLAPDADQRAALARELDLLDLPALRMTGAIRAEGKDDWRLTAHLAARVVQPCVVTLAPVETAIEDEVRILYSPHAPAPDEDEAEMPDDETEPLGATIDLAAVMAEALSLALPLYPRAPDATFDEGEAAPDPDRQQPFAGLADLLKRDG